MMSADALKVQSQLETKYISEIPSIDETALKLYENELWKARNFLQNFLLNLHRTLLTGGKS
jgi:hypothetical protein